MFDRRKEKGVLIGLAVLFFLIYSWFGTTTAKIFNSPDETANYFYISRYVEFGDFFMPEPLNYFLGNNVHPRSISYNGYSLVPQGFIGLAWFYGFLAKFFSLGSVKFFTPILSAAGALAFFGLIRIIFNKKIALLSFLLLLLLPAHWYYSSRFLYPNIPFASFLIIAIWTLASGALKKGGKKIYTIIFALSLALSLAIRPVEIFWIAGGALILGMVYRKDISWRRVFGALAIAIFTAIPVFASNLFLYGGVFKSGYTLKDAVVYGNNFFNGELGDIKNNFLPYGFHPRAVWNNFRNVFINNLWWYAAPAFLGIYLWARSRPKKEEKIYFYISLAISTWLLIFYGSGVFTDNPNIIFTIGDSHFRYWLPVFMAWIPFAAYFFIRLLKKKLAIASVLAACAFLSMLAVYFSPDDGLLMVKNNLLQNYKVKTAAEKLVEPNDVIITSRQDKIFFPERKILYIRDIKDFKRPELFLNISELGGRDFYYYGIGLRAKEFFELNEMLKIYGFKMERVDIFGKEVLYKLKKIQSRDNIK